MACKSVCIYVVEQVVVVATGRKSTHAKSWDGVDGISISA